MLEGAISPASSCVLTMPPADTVTLCLELGVSADTLLMEWFVVRARQRELKLFLRPDGESVARIAADTHTSISLPDRIIGDWAAFDPAKAPREAHFMFQVLYPRRS